MSLSHLLICFSQRIAREAVLSKKTYYYLHATHRLIIVTLLGFASGLPLALTGSALQGWYTKAGASLVTIGTLGLLGLPYVFKFLWAFFFDRFYPPVFGRRRGWILLMQLALTAAIFALTFCHPMLNPWLMWTIGLTVAFFSANQDITIDAYRTEILLPRERGLGVAFGVTGYRIAMVVSGGLAFIMADHIGWVHTFRWMGGIMVICTIITVFAPEPRREKAPPHSLIATFVESFMDFLRRDSAIAILVMIVLYKLGDAFAGSLTTTFLLRGIGFSQTDVGAITKVVGLIASLSGVFLGGILMTRISLYRALMSFGILQGVSNLVLMWLALVGKNYTVMSLAIFIENFCGGLGTTALIVLFMSLCNIRYTASQFALLTALSAVGRVFVGPIAGVMVEHIGWVDFYLWTAILSLPGLCLLWWLRHRLELGSKSVGGASV